MFFFRIQSTSTRSIRVNFCDPQVRVAKLDRALPTAAPGMPLESGAWPVLCALVLATD